MPGIVIPLGKIAPELGIGRRRNLDGIDKHAVVLSHDFAELIAKHSAKILVGSENFPIQGEFDRRLGLVQGCKN